MLVGVTENMSRSGILVAWSADRLTGLPKVGDPLTVDIELPANHSFGQRCMHCQTVVTRVSNMDTGWTRVALQVSQMQFRSYNNGRFAVADHDEVGCSLM